MKYDLKLKKFVSNQSEGEILKAIKYNEEKVQIELKELMNEIKETLEYLVIDDDCRYLNIAVKNLDSKMQNASYKLSKLQAAYRELILLDDTREIE